MSNVDPQASPATPTQAGSSFGNVSPTQDQEVVFYEGSPKLRGELGLVFKCFVAALVIVLLYYGCVWLFKLNISPLVDVVIWLVSLLVLVLPLLLIRKNRYRISNYRIDYEQGLLSKRIDTLELWHVEDVQMEQSIFDRILRVGTINVNSSDRTTPRLELKSLPEPRSIYDAIKQRVIAVKRQRGVVKFDGGGGPDHDHPNDPVVETHHH